MSGFCINLFEETGLNRYLWLSFFDKTKYMMQRQLVSQ